VPLGFVEVKVKDVDKVKNLNMYVVKFDRDPLLGREWMNQLKIFSKTKNSLVEIEDVKAINTSGQKSLEELLKRYDNLISEEFNCIKKYETHLKLKSDVKPVFI